MLATSDVDEVTSRDEHADMGRPFRFSRTVENSPRVDLMFLPSVDWKGKGEGGKRGTKRRTREEKKSRSADGRSQELLHGLTRWLPSSNSPEGRGGVAAWEFTVMSSVERRSPAEGDLRKREYRDAVGAAGRVSSK